MIKYNPALSAGNLSGSVQDRSSYGAVEMTFPVVRNEGRCCRSLGQRNFNFACLPTVRLVALLFAV